MARGAGFYCDPLCPANLQKSRADFFLRRRHPNVPRRPPGAAGSSCAPRALGCEGLARSAPCSSSPCWRRRRRPGPRPPLTRTRTGCWASGAPRWGPGTPPPACRCPPAGALRGGGPGSSRRREDRRTRRPALGDGGLPPRRHRLTRSASSPSSTHAAHTQPAGQAAAPRRRGQAPARGRRSRLRGGGRGRPVPPGAAGPAGGGGGGEPVAGGGAAGAAGGGVGRAAGRVRQPLGVPRPRPGPHQPPPARPPRGPAARRQGPRRPGGWRPTLGTGGAALTEGPPPLPRAAGRARGDGAAPGGAGGERGGGPALPRPRRGPVPARRLRPVPRPPRRQGARSRRSANASVHPVVRWERPTDSADRARPDGPQRRAGRAGDGVPRGRRPRRSRGPRPAPAARPPGPPRRVAGRAPGHHPAGRPRGGGSGRSPPLPHDAGREPQDHNLFVVRRLTRQIERSAPRRPTAWRRRTRSGVGGDRARGGTHCWRAGGATCRRWTGPCRRRSSSGSSSPNGRCG